MKLRFHLCGASAIFMDASVGPFNLRTQEHLWSMTARGSRLHRLHGVRSLVLGVNNLLVAFDPCEIDLDALRAALEEAWRESVPSEVTGSLVEVPVQYGRSRGSELEGIARHAGMDTEEVIRLHTSVEYRVACIGSVPGFAYLVGLPPELAVPRHQTPRPRIAKGSVAIGGAQTGVIPMDMPSGWHVLGVTQLDLFDAMRTAPSLLSAGDRIRFVDQGAVQ